MGFEYSAESRIMCKEKENEVLEISSLNSDQCDNIESFTIDYLFDHIIPERLCDVTIDITKISVLELSHCNLTELPADCKKLNLTHLGLSHNKLKQVPLCLYSGLKYLESLDLSHNEIEHFNMEPQCLPYVKVVKLNHNDFENIPKWFLMFKCTQLEEFNYSYNKAQHYKYLKNSVNLSIIKLRKLELINNCLIDDDYNFLKCFKFLRYLDISNEDTRLLNKFDDLDDLFVKPKWKELHFLRLNGLSLSILPEGVAWIYTLKELHVTNNNLSWLPDGIEFLVNLEVLNVSNNTLVAIPANIVSLESLIVLQASNNCIDGVPDFSQIGSLKTLDLYNNFLDSVKFNTATFDLVDLEYNYYNTENLEHYSEYQQKKDCLRKQFKSERYDGPKEYCEEHISSSSSSEDEEYYSEETDFVSVCPAALDDDEDWDLPDRVKKKNPEIDSVDEEWLGEERKLPLKLTKSENKIYVSDDDWMFTDFEES